MRLCRLMSGKSLTFRNRSSKSLRRGSASPLFNGKLCAGKAQLFRSSGGTAAQSLGNRLLKVFKKI